MLIQKFSQDIIKQVWEKGHIIPGQNPSLLRKDDCNAVIAWNMYGNRNDKFNSGWEIDHITPESKGGSDSLYNLRPLQWYNNASKQDERLICPVTAKL